MQILVVSATEHEIYPYRSANASADILVTGVGVPAALYHLSKRIHLMDYDLVIQAGVAGSFLHEIEIGEVVGVRRDTFADLGIREGNNFSNLFDSALAENDHPFKNGYLYNNNSLFESCYLKKVNGITVNTITDDHEVLSNWVLKYDPAIESMEGAALHYVCIQESVPFIQIRAISNYAGERNKANWDLQGGITNLNVALQRVIDGLGENYNSYS
jgi:futalosine hydrolase